MADKKVKNYKKVDSRTALQDDREEKLEQIKEILPHLVTGDNKLDVEALKDILEDSISTTGQGYNLNFAGKGLARIKADEPTKKELKLEDKQSKELDETENVIIRGDNLDALKILWNNYYGKIKMIYIDPPYNTDSANFVYEDSFRESEAELIEKYGLDEEKINFFENMFGTRTHSGWLYFMYPRLKLARDLLTDDGVIFISIDDNEQANLKLLCNEIFGANNFISNMVWHSNTNIMKGSSYVRKDHEYVLVYKKSSELEKIRLENTKLKFQNPDNDPKGDWLDTNAVAPQGGYYFGIALPTGETCYRRWKFLEEDYKEGLIPLYFKEGNVPRLKAYKSEYDTRRKVPSSLILEKTIEEAPSSMLLDKASTTTGKNELASLCECDAKMIPFDNPKDPNLLKYLFRFTDDKNAIILDFFAGSGTTAQAVMELNEEDEGNRKFILVQWDEEIDPEKSKTAYDFCIEKGLEPIISSVCVERANLAGEKAIKDKNVDTGYKIFSLVDHPDVIASETSEQNHFNINRVTIKDTLYNMIVASREALLSDVIEEIEKDNLYKVRDSYYLLRKCETNLKDKKFNKIFVDGYADINLEDWLNLLGLGEDKVEILY